MKGASEDPEYAMPAIARQLVPAVYRVKSVLENSCAKRAYAAL
jgi:hypothetical protein